MIYVFYYVISFLLSSTFLSRKECHTDVHLCILYYLHNVVFIEVPQSVTVNSGGQAQFRCEHPSAEGYIWLINGTALRNLPQNVLMNFIEENGVLLLGQALPEYNMTSVQCVATFTNRLPLQSFHATLTVQGEIVCPIQCILHVLCTIRPLVLISLFPVHNRRGHTGL